MEILITYFNQFLKTGILTGTLSSLLAVLLIEIYLFLRKKTASRKLKSVLSLTTDSCLLVSPIFGQKLNPALIHHKDAFAFGHIISLCHRLNKDVNIIAFHKYPESIEALDLFLVGGPASNEITNSYLKKFIKNFSYIEENSSSLIKNGIEVNTGKWISGVKIGNSIFKFTKDEEFGILIKLTSNELNQDRTVHILFGYSGQGTGAAGFFLSNKYVKIFNKFRNKKYCIAFKVARNESYKVVSSNFEDLTSEAFL